ncbi:MAG: hypothetical protein R3B07_36960 [Polyangiaceae bacterium]
MSKPDAKLSALAGQAGLGAFRALYPYAAKNRNRLLWKLVGSTLFTGVLLLGGIALFMDGELTPIYPLFFLASAGWWAYTVYALYKGWSRKVQVHEGGLVYATHKETQLVPWVDLVGVRMNVTEYVGAENYYEGDLNLTLRTDGYGTEFYREIRMINIPSEFQNIEQLMQELRRAEDIGRRLRKRLNPDRGVTRFEMDGQVTYRFVEDLDVSPMNWEDELGPLARLQTPEQQLTHHFYAQALFQAYNAAGQGDSARHALESLGYTSVGGFLRAYVTLLKYYGVPGANPDVLEAREWGELAVRCDQAAIRRLQEDIAAGHQRLPGGAPASELSNVASQLSKRTGHPRRPSQASRAA